MKIVYYHKMTSILHQNRVLVLNALYQPIGTLSIQKALVAMNSEAGDGTKAAKAIDIQYEKQEDGSFNLEKVKSFQAYSFEEWLMVDFRDGLDLVISTPKMKVRAPSILITSYSKMPMRKIRPTKSVLYEKQKGICGYSGKKMSMKQMNIKHKHAKSHGGKDTFQNLMLVDSKINHARGNKPLEQVGLKPLFTHKEPQPLPVAYVIKSAVHPDWNYFIAK
jgi:5-methylcytosine-specific restriction endonuclease McrA